MRVAADRIRAAGPAALPVAAAYAVLGALLVASRVVGLGRSYASDELATVRNFVRAGPREILTGPYIPNNHELFSLIGWATTSVVGESAVALRLWSAVPFVLGAMVVAAWLHVKIGALSGVLFLFLVTASPLLLDITRQARGYGLAFLAAAVLTVAALEAIRSGRTAFVTAFCVAGVVGTWTLPNFGLAFFTTGAVLLTDRKLRRRVAMGLTASIGAIVAWYSPHLADLLESSRQDYAAPIETAWLVTAPLDQIVVPALAGIDEVLVDPGVASLLVVIALAIVMAASPLLRSRPEALVLVAGAVVSIVALWITRTHVAPRFLSFLLVPLLILLGTGSAAILARFFAGGRPLLRTIVALTLLAVVGTISVQHAEEIVRLPREASGDVAALIRTHSPPGTPVYAYVPYPGDVEAHLGRRVERPRTPEEVRAVCAVGREAVLVTQPWIVQPVSVPCTSRPGARHHRLEQYARGERMDVWLIPAGS